MSNQKKSPSLWLTINYSTIWKNSGESFWFFGSFGSMNPKNQRPKSSFQATSKACCCFPRSEAVATARWSCCKASLVRRAPKVLGKAETFDKVDILPKCFDRSWEPRKWEWQVKGVIRKRWEDKSWQNYAKRVFEWLVGICFFPLEQESWYALFHGES